MGRGVMEGGDPSRAQTQHQAPLPPRKGRGVPCPPLPGGGDTVADPGSPASEPCPRWWGMGTRWPGGGQRVHPTAFPLGLSQRTVAPTGCVPPVCPGERPPCVVGLQRGVLLPEVPTAKPPYHRETLMTMTEMPQEMSATAEVPQEMVSAMAELSAEALPAVPSVVPAAEAGKDPCGVELPPCPGKWGTCPTEVPLIAVPVLPTSLQPPVEQPSRVVPRGSCLIRNWQEEVTPHHRLGGQQGKCPSKPAPPCPTC